MNCGLIISKYLEPKSEYSLFSETKTSVFSKSTNKYESKGIRDETTNIQGLYFENAKKINVNPLVKYNQFLDSIRRKSSKRGERNSGQIPELVFHPNREINDLVKVILNLKSDDSEHLKVSKILKEAILQKQPVECKGRFLRLIESPKF